jgi:hypothetical protein
VKAPPSIEGLYKKDTKTKEKQKIKEHPKNPKDSIKVMPQVEWVMPRTVLELLSSWGAAIGCGHAKEAWRLASLCLLWCIWREQNARLFEDVETSMVELRKRLLNTLYFWIAAHHSLSVFTYVEFLNLFSVRPF